MDPQLGRMATDSCDQETNKNSKPMCGRDRDNTMLAIYRHTDTHTDTHTHIHINMYIM